jgi:hypothetical protein
MSNEYYAKYEHLSHKELYDMLMAGKPGQVQGSATGWTKLRDGTDGLSSALTRDLQRLAGSWSSPSGQEYQRRVGLIGEFSNQLSEDFGVMQEQLSSLSGDLTRAQGKAEDPADIHPHNMLKDAAVGAGAGSFLGPAGTLIGGTIGAIHGHDADEEEKEKARQRMIQVVADLAGTYSVVGTSRWSTAPAPPPADLPGGGGSGVGTAIEGTSGSGIRASSVGGLGTGEVGRHRAAAPSGSAAPVTPLGSAGNRGQSTSPNEPTGGLSGTGLGATGAALLGAGLVDAAALDMALGRAGMPAGGAGQGTTGGVSGAARRLTDGVIGNESRPAGPGGRAATNLVRTGPTDGRSGMGTGSRGQEDEPDEHLTWLTEDEMVWGGDGPVAPAVVGGTEPAEPAEQTQAETETGSAIGG